MKARIEEIRIQNFRALGNVRLRLSDLTFLVGRNGAGKSSILDAVEFMREALTDSLPNALNRRGGLVALRPNWGPGSKVEPNWERLAEVGIAVVMRVTLPGRTVRILYGFKLSTAAHAAHIAEALQVLPGQQSGFNRVDAEFTSLIPAHPLVPKDRLLLPLVASEQLWEMALRTLTQMRAYEIDPHAIARPSPIQNATTLDKNGANAGDVLEELQSRRPAHEAVLSLLQAVTPGIVDVQGGALRGQRDISFWQQVGSVVSVIGANHMSQGTLRALGILLALHQSPEPTLVLIDEIEDSIHPRALEAILEAVEQSIERFPVVLTTHSPEVLGKRQVTAERMRITQWEQGVSRLYALSEGTKDSLDPVTTVGDLLRVNALWPAESPESFTGDILELSE